MMPIDANVNQGGVCPHWLVDLDPKLAGTLTSIDQIFERLRTSVENGYGYQDVFQQQIHAVTDKLIADGVMSREDFDSPMGPSRKILKRIAPSQNLVATLASNNSGSFRLLGTMSYTCRLAVVKLLGGLQQGLLSGDVLVPFVCLRGVIEHIAHYHAVIVKLRPYSVPHTFEEASKTLLEINMLLVKSGYGTRIDWKGLFASDVDKYFDAERLKYVPEENRADRESRSIMSEVDSLNKMVKGTRPVYEVLCEFAHPNVGNLFIFTETAGPFTDAQGVLCVKKRLSPSPPIAFLKEWAAPAKRIFEQVDRCLQHLESLLDAGNNEREKVLKITQVVVGRLVRANINVFNAYGSCPCGSEKKVKFCCGKSAATCQTQQP